MPDAADKPHATLAAALDSVGDRWTLLVVAALMDAPRRFGDLQSDLDGIASNVLTARLRGLEERRLVLAQPYSERPLRVVYELTDAGRELAGVLRLLADWGARRQGDGAAPRHSVCGTPLQAGLFCPTCAVPVAHPDTEELHFA